MSDKDGDIICVVTARGGSRGVPRKNLLEIGGMPLVARSVRIMLEANLPDYCFVSTDDEEIAQVCRDYGAEVPFLRPAELSADDIPIYSVLHHSIEWYEGSVGRPVKIVSYIQPTGPFALAQDIDVCINAALVHADCTAATACSEARHNPYYVMFETVGGYLESVMTERGYDGLIKGTGRRLLCRQEAPSVLQAAGMVWAIKRETVMELESTYGPRAVPIVVDAERFCDIDYPMDVVRARAQHKYLVESGKISF